MRPLFQLDSRLKLCASMVPAGAVLADVGTDHAYLPVWLVKSGAVRRAVAVDVKEGPLLKARETVLKYQAEEGVELRLSDGLAAIAPGEADTVAVAGMGGELIASILAKAPWLKEHRTRLVLQPMSSAEELRLWLQENRFQLIEERPVLSGGRAYSAMLARYSGEEQKTGPLYPYLGRLTDCAFSDEEERRAARAYEERVLRNLKKRRAGAEARNQREAAARLALAIDAIGKLAAGRF